MSGLGEWFGAGSGVGVGGLVSLVFGVVPLLAVVFTRSPAWALMIGYLFAVVVGYVFDIYPFFMAGFFVMEALLVWFVVVEGRRW